MLSNVHVLFVCLFVCLFCSDSSDSDSVEIMTPLTTPIIDFRKVISAHTTPTPSLLKTTLKLPNTTKLQLRDRG